MGRMMPINCRHGFTVDWGDFGHCQDCDEHDDGACPNLSDCPDYETARNERWKQIAAWRWIVVWRWIADSDGAPIIMERSTLRSLLDLIEDRQ